MKVLSRVFRNKYRALLQKAFARGELKFFGQLGGLAEARAFVRYLDAATRREWVVYAKRPFQNTSCVLKYLARYTHRVAISNSRLLAYRGGQVTFRYKDYARDGQQRTMTLAAAEFIRRFLLHVLPTGFMRIRNYGYLANNQRREKLATCRRLLGCAAPSVSLVEVEEHDSGGPPAAGDSDEAAEAASPCPRCQVGRMRITETLVRIPARDLTGAGSPAHRLDPPRNDSS